MAASTRFDCIPLTSWVAEYGKFAEDYVAVDIESTGVDSTRDYPIQVGFCRVKNRKAVLSADYVIDWMGFLRGPALTDFEQRLETTRIRMAEKEKAYPWTRELLRERGKPPTEVVRKLTEIFRGQAIAAHYGLMLDFPVLGRVLAQYGGEFAPEVNRILDTGLLVKACYVSISPTVGEDPIQYYRRIMDARTVVRHNLEACVEFFGLKAEGAVPAHAHLAGYDSWLVHMLVEKLRRHTSAAEYERTTSG